MTKRASSSNEEQFDAMAPINQEAGETAVYPLHVVNALLGHLSEKEADILSRRFGLRDFLGENREKEKETLDGIGKIYKVTRERVRQIQNQCINKLKNALEDAKNQELLSSVEKNIHSVIKEYGGAMEENVFLQEFLKDCDSLELNRKASLFLMSQFLSGNLKALKSNNDFKSSWLLDQTPVDFLKKTVSETVKIIQTAGCPMKMEEILKSFKKTDFYRENKKRLNDAVILSYLNTSKAIRKNSFGYWGIASWQTITPRRVADKIYLILKTQDRPLHFAEIARLINEQKFDDKNAHPATVHNELILNKEKYVLIGRGIYALREWGYRPGVISDILMDILTERGKPMGKEELAEEVLKQRMVKRETVYLALMNKKLFQKMPEDRYVLAASPSQSLNI